MSIRRWRNGKIWNHEGLSNRWRFQLPEKLIKEEAAESLSKSSEVGGAKSTYRLTIYRIGNIFIKENRFMMGTQAWAPYA